MKKLFTVVVACMVALFTFAACGTPAASEQPEAAAPQSAASEQPQTGGGEADAGEKDLKFGITFMRTHPAMVSTEKGFHSVADPLGIELLVYWAEDNLEKQLGQVDDLLAQDIDGLFIMAVDNAGIKPALEKAKAKGVPVIMLDSPADDGDLTVAWVGSDNFAAGALCAEDVVQRVGGGNVAILSHPVVSAGADRVEGFKSVIEKDPNFTIISEQASDGDANKAMAVMENVLQANQQVDVVFGLNDASAMGAIAALKAANRLEGTYVYGVDGQKDFFALIEQGEGTGTAAQDVYSFGVKALENMMKHLDGEQVEYDIVVPVVLVTKENMGIVDGF